MNMGLHEDLQLPIVGEGQPVIRYPGDEGWAGISLAWMSHGYEVAMTPIQTLAFYNAVANDGIMVRPRFLKEARIGGKAIRRFIKEVLNSSICSQETVKKAQKLLKDVVEKDFGTGNGLYSSSFSMAGKTGTCQKNYVAQDPDKLAYISSFVGYFPADQPKYSCIVVIHEPDKSVGYYGADVSGPVFKSLAQKIYSNSPVVDEVAPGNTIQNKLEENYNNYYAEARKAHQNIPNVKGMSGMDAISILENMGIQVEVRGNGKVKSQSVEVGKKLENIKKVVLELS